MCEGERLRRGGCRQVKGEKIPYFCFSERIWRVQNTPEPSRYPSLESNIWKLAIGRRNGL